MSVLSGSKKELLRRTAERLELASRSLHAEATAASPQTTKQVRAVGGAVLLLTTSVIGPVVQGASEGAYDQLTGKTTEATQSLTRLDIQIGIFENENAADRIADRIDAAFQEAEWIASELNVGFGVVLKEEPSHGQSTDAWLYENWYTVSDAVGNIRSMIADAESMFIEPGVVQRLNGLENELTYLQNEIVILRDDAAHRSELGNR